MGTEFQNDVNNLIDKLKTDTESNTISLIGLLEPLTMKKYKMSHNDIGPSNAVRKIYISLQIAQHNGEQPSSMNSYGLMLKLQELYK